MAARQANDGAIWPIILEKALAKMQGNYYHIAGGQGYNGIRFMRGGPWHRKEIKFMTPDQIWDFIGDKLGNGDLITAGTPGTSDSKKDKWGIVQSHAYTVAGRVTLSTGEKLVRIRNPWGRDSYRGQFGADSPKWTSALEKEVPDAKNSDDGYEYLPINQFKVSFERLAANHNAEKMKMDYFMMLDDKSKNKPKPGV